ncbi:unnamed protein product [Clonostachys rosea]|uniref:Actin n=1 Tax=Bionectria ochroleuca TaxID=29856 RepID=A0ABY6UHY1_BIOOC|nr:unnamed protein product [Clonostachys rosea]
MDRPLFDQRRPVDDGIITNFSDIEWIWDYLYEKRLKVKSEDHPLLLAEPNMNSQENREKVVTLLFEQFHVPALYLAMQGVLAIHPSGSSTGVVLDSGTSSTYAVPVYEGLALRHECLTRGGNDLGTMSDRKLARKVKEEYCYVAQDFRRELQLAQAGTSTETSYKLADGKSITVGRERFTTPEAFFHPQRLGLNSQMGIHHLAFGAILKSDASIQNRLYGNIVLARMHSEMAGLAPSSANVRIIASPERKHSAWIGGSMVASLSTFQKMCVLYEEYDEVGPTIVLRRWI